MDPRRIEKINADLKDRTGVDFSRYRNPELSEMIVIETLKRRVPFAGGLGAWVTERFFTIVDDRGRRDREARAGAALGR